MTWAETIPTREVSADARSAQHGGRGEPVQPAAGAGEGGSVQFGDAAQLAVAGDAQLRPPLPERRLPHLEPGSAAGLEFTTGRRRCLSTDVMDRPGRGKAVDLILVEGGHAQANLMAFLTASSAAVVGDTFIEERLVFSPRGSHGVLPGRRHLVVAGKTFDACLCLTDSASD
jgi:hypothetical protein